MTKTNREYIYQVKKILKETYGDSRVTNKFVYSLLTKHAKWLIRRESNALKLAKYQSLYQTYKCVEVIEAPLIDPCCGISSLCKVWRTKEKLPELFEDTDGVLITNITSVDRSYAYDFMTPDSIQRKLNNPWVQKYNTARTYAFYENGYLYFTERTVLVEVRGMFTKDISTLGKCGKEQPCIPFLDQPFYLPGYLEAEVISHVEKELASLYKAIPEDININKNPGT